MVQLGRGIVQLSKLRSKRGDDVTVSQWLHGLRNRRPMALPLTADGNNGQVRV